MAQAFIDLFYLLAAALFILGLRDMSHPRRAVRGNLFGSAGMLVAIVVTLLDTASSASRSSLWGWYRAR